MGATVLVLPKLGPVRVIAPCRVVSVVDEEERFSFAYGTLRGHPECGEESFVVARQAEGTMFRITAFSCPTDHLTRIGTPVARRVQHRFTVRYLTALARFVATGA